MLGRGKQGGRGKTGGSHLDIGQGCLILTSRSSGEPAELSVIRRKAPHNQRIEQTPFGRSSSAALGNNVNPYGGATQ